MPKFDKRKKEKAVLLQELEQLLIDKNEEIVVSAYRLKVEDLKTIIRLIKGVKL